MSPAQRKLCKAVADAVDANGGKSVHLTAQWWAEIGSSIRTVQACLLAGYLLRESINGKLHWFVHQNTYAKIGRKAPRGSNEQSQR
jgi:hypothetical protein